MDNAIAPPRINGTNKIAFRKVGIPTAFERITFRGVTPHPRCSTYVASNEDKDFL